jgi:hypothetical protein
MRPWMKGWLLMPHSMKLSPLGGWWGECHLWWVEGCKICFSQWYTDIHNRWEMWSMLVLCSKIPMCRAVAAEMGIYVGSVLAHWTARRPVGSGFHTCWMKISVSHLSGWHLHIFSDGGGTENDFSCHILTVAELWMYSSDPEPRCQIAEWDSLTLTWNKISRKCPSTLKVMHVMFFCHVGLVMDHLVPPQTLVSGVYYAKLLPDNAFWCQWPTEGTQIWMPPGCPFGISTGVTTVLKVISSHIKGEVQRTCIEDMWHCFLLYSAYWWNKFVEHSNKFWYQVCTPDCNLLGCDTNLGDDDGALEEENCVFLLVSSSKTAWYHSLENHNMKIHFPGSLKTYQVS